MSVDTLRITEIFYSLQGETNTVGLPTVFVRLTGCPLRCQYCDTAYAFKGGDVMAIEDVMVRVRDEAGGGEKEESCVGSNKDLQKYVTVTGGEPLAQKEGCLKLLRELCDAGYRVSLETSGAISVEGVDSRVVKIVDFKTPGSGECARNDFGIVDFLDAKDQVKFVICDRVDYEWAVDVIGKYSLSESRDGLGGRCELLFSPSYEELKAVDLADWIVEDRLPVRMQVQLHKILWGDQKGK